jgi:DNA-binding NtrC family response regulator
MATRDGGSGSAAVGPEMLPLGRGETVLIVESEQERLLRDEEELAALGYEPVGFERPADALAACRSEPGRFDVILVSHGSQNHGGLDLARAFHEIAPKQPVLLAAASSIDVSVDALAEAGISEVLRWPLASAELAPRWRAACGARLVTTVTRFPIPEILV